MTDNTFLETYEEEFEYECIECGEQYKGSDCPNCGSELAKVFNDEEELAEEELAELLF